MRRRYQVLVSTCLLNFLVFAASTVLATPGGLDTTFSQDGFLNQTLLVGGGSDVAHDSAVQADGKIVITGRMQYGYTDACTVSRFNSNGTLDATFDGDGKIFLLKESWFSCNAIAVQNDGKIVVAGVSYWGASADRFAVARFNSDGTPDNTFSGDGFVSTVLSSNDDIARDVLIQTDGKIVVAGSAGPGANTDFAILRYLSNGDLDTTFDGDGVAITSISAGYDSCYAVTLQPDGKIIAVGSIAQGVVDYGIVRYNSDGSLDTSFGGGGKVTTDLGGHYDNALGVALAADGKIVVAGYSYQSPWPVFSAARYKPDGTLDTSFSNDGIVLTHIFSASSDTGSDVVVQPDGKVIVIGYSGGGGSILSAVRYSIDGSLDTTFGGDGIVNRDFRDQDEMYSGNLQPDGKLVIAGFAKNDFALGDAAVYRFNADGTEDNTFNGNGLALSDQGISNSGAEAIAIQADGKIVSAGAVFNGTSSDFAITRHLPNGSIDTTFGNNGVTLSAFDNSAYDSITSIAIQPDGKIVAAGNTGGDTGIARYLPNGTLDQSFGFGGLVKVTGGSTQNFVYSVAIQADGKIVAGGEIAQPAGLNKFYVLRFNADGSADSTFGSGGVVVTPIFDAPSNDEVRQILIQPDAKILAIGTAYSSSFRFAAVRYNPNGTLDPTFAGAGLLSIDVGGGSAMSGALQPDGKIIFVGSNGNASSGNFIIVRTLADGTLDTSFDGDGKVFTGQNMKATSVGLQANGKIVVAGYSGDGGSFNGGDIVLARYNSNGSLDNTYGAGNGIATADLVSGVGDRANDVAIDSSGRAVVIGFSAGLYSLARFQGDSAVGLNAPFDFDADRRTDLSIFRPSQGEWWYLRSSDGLDRAFSFGNSADRLAPADYTGDGKADISFWRPSTGEWFVMRSESATYYAFPFGTTGDTPVAGDFDGDGRSDNTIFRASTNTWYINRSSGGTDIVSFGQSGDKPVVGDYDGDLRADIAVWRPSLGQWWIRRSSTGIVYVVSFGGSADRPVQGDFTGDGKTDTAFYRSSTGEWFILRSEDNSYFAVPFGIGSDTPIPGDYDGDGRYDLAVFRPSTATWFVDRSTAGVYIVSFGASSDVPVPSVYIP